MFIQEKSGTSFLMNSTSGSWREIAQGLAICLCSIALGIEKFTEILEVTMDIGM